MNLTGIWLGETVYINPRQAAKKEKADGEDAQHLFLPIEQFAAYTCILVSYRGHFLVITNDVTVVERAREAS